MPADAEDVLTIVHVSDIHVGRAFNEDLWNGFTDACAELRPDVIAVTGDLVDWPFRWSLRAAAQRLTELKERVSRTRATPCRILVVPGNHDTRLTGLVPLLGASWLVTIWVVAAAVAGALLCTMGPADLHRLAWVVFLLLVLVMAAFTVLQALCGDVRKQLGGDAITLPVTITAGRVSAAFYPFDSASRKIPFAGGEIPLDQFRTTRYAPAPAGPDAPPPSCRIALVHHHPLPIPYDNPSEEMMILRNAGALLLELARRDVSLVLHGHKHHWNFARVAMSAEREAPHELAVLAGPTLTRGRVKADGAGYGFNHLAVDAVGHVRVTPYDSNGGVFEVRPFFYAESVAARLRRLQAQAETRHGVACDAIIARTTLTPDGDALERVEYAGFRVLPGAAARETMPGGVIAEVTEGYIERFEAGLLDERAPRALRLDVDGPTLRRQRGRIAFGRAVHATDAPFGFFKQFHAINSYAMSAQQFARAYPGAHPPATEAAATRMPVFAARVLHTSVVFPRDFRIDGLPDLEITDAQGARLPLVERHCRDFLHFDAAGGVVHLSVAAPPPEATFRILWKLTDEAPPAGRGVRSLQGRVKELAEALAGFARAAPAARDRNMQLRLYALVVEMESQVRTMFRLEGGQEALGVSLMAYDRAEELLRVVAGNAMVGDDTEGFTLRYGDGIAGRAYKMNRIRHFVKARAEETQTPYYYYPRDGKPGAAGIEHEVVLAIPLTHPQDATAAYGVFNCNSRKPSSRLIDLESAEIESVSLAALNRFCFETLCEVFHLGR